MRSSAWARQAARLRADGTSVDDSGSSVDGVCRLGLLCAGVQPGWLVWVLCAFCSHDICSNECGPGVGAQVKPGIVSAATHTRPRACLDAWMLGTRAAAAATAAAATAAAEDLTRRVDSAAGSTLAGSGCLRFQGRPRACCPLPSR